MTSTKKRASKLGIEASAVRRARTLARQVGKPIVDLATRHTTVSVERATLRLAGLDGADPDGLAGRPPLHQLVENLTHGPPPPELRRTPSTNGPR